jgi:serine/threonine-protein kinase
VEAALALLRPIAYELHRQERRDDLSTAELVLMLRQGLDSLQVSAQTQEVRHWLHRRAGVLEDYGAGRWGFTHLGIQEYLTALHIATEGGEVLDELVEHAGEKWWREAILLLVGLPGRQVFGPLMKRLLARKDWDQELLQACVNEATELDVGPFVEVLTSGKDSALQAAIMRLSRVRNAPELVACVEQLQSSKNADLAALARQVVQDARGTAAGGVGTPAAHHLCLLCGPEHQEAAQRLHRQLGERGLQLWPELLGANPGWQERVEEILAGVRVVALVLGPGGSLPWQQRGLPEFLKLAAKDGLLLVPVLLPGSRRPSTVPEPLASVEWVDLGADERRGLVEVQQRVLDKVAEVQRLVTPAAAEAGQAFVDGTTGIRLLPIPGGRFQMGSDRYDIERPIHWVRLSDFWLAETPVTNQQYGKFLEGTGHAEPTYWRDRRFSQPEQPVLGVSWEDAMAFCEWLAKESGQPVTLPSEAQWEYAARGTDGREYPWGGEEPDETRACFDQDWKTGRPAAVGSFPQGRGPFGTLDQAGNVWEWCLDVWDEKAYQKRSREEPLDPVVREGGSFRPLRGGSWLYHAEDLRSAFRSWLRAARRLNYLGFRVAVAPASR